MEISRQADYAVRTVLNLAKEPGCRMHAHEIAKCQAIPEKGLPAIVKALSRAGLLRTYKGNNSGITLARPPEEITLREVVEAIEGPLIFNPCRTHPGKCARVAPCSLHQFWEEMAEEMRQQMESVTFKELADRL